jgi:hypothetical protein
MLNLTNYELDYILGDFSLKTSSYTAHCAATGVMGTEVNVHPQG